MAAGAAREERNGRDGISCGRGYAAAAERGGVRGREETRERASKVERIQNIDSDANAIRERRRKKWTEAGERKDELT